MPTIDYDFNNSLDYIFDSNSIDISGSAARLKFQAGSLSFNADLNTDAGFNYDNTKIEFTGGVAQQKDVTPINSIFGVSYVVNASPITNEADLNWHKGGGAIAGILNGAPTIVNGKLVCNGVQGVYYSKISAGRESHKFLYMPNYSGLPPSNVNLFTCTNGVTDSDRFLLTHSPSSGGTLRLTLNANNSTVVIPVATVVGSTWTPTLGQEYEYEIVIDSIAGTVRVFIDGVLFGTNTPGAWTRGSATLRYYLGASPEIYNVAAASFDNYISFDNAQHTADYTPGYTVVSNIYLASNVDFPLFTHAGLGAMRSLTSLSVLQSGSTRYTLSLDSTPHLYYDGLAWTVSNQSYAQSNDEATINSNLSTFPSSLGASTLDVRALFEDTNIQSSIDNLTMFYLGDVSYITSNPALVPNTTVLSHALNTFSVAETVIGLDKVQYILRSNNIDKYFDGIAWVVSDGTFAQSNNAATIQVNLATFLDTGTLVPIIILHSDDGTTTPEIQNIFMDYDFFGALPSPENVCVVWGFLYNEINQPVPNVEVKITPVTYGVIDEKLINREQKTAVTDSQGYWQIALVETESTQNNWAYKFELPGYESKRVVPDQISARFNDLLPAP